MREGFFGGSYGGDAAKIAAGNKLECKICWYVYDPAIGDDYWQVPAGTPFAALPAHWSCPTCDGRKEDFIVLAEPGDG